MTTITILDRAVALSSGMAGSLYVLAACVMWWSVAVRRKPVGRVAGVQMKNVILDRAFAWTAYALVFFAITAGRLQWIHKRDLGWILMISSAVVLIAGLFSVREITRAQFGNRALAFFVVAIALAGMALWLWG